MIIVGMICPELFMSFVICFAIYPAVQPMYFFDVFVTSTSLQSGAFVNADFRDLAFPLSHWTVYLIMPYVHVVS